MKKISYTYFCALLIGGIFFIAMSRPAPAGAQTVSWANETLYATVNCGSVGGNCPGYTSQRVSTNDFNDKEPQINNRGDIVWLGHAAPGNFEIFFRSAADNQVVRVTTNTQDDTFAKINEAGALAWMAFDGHDWEIYRYSEGNMQQITDNDIDDKYPKINNAGDIAWIAGIPDSKGEVQDYNIFLFYQGEVSAITNDASFNVQVRLNDSGDLMWRAKGVANFDIFTRRDGVITQETSNDFLEMYPQLSNNGQMVWTKNDGTDEEIMLKLTGDLEARQITNNETSDFIPMLNERGTVVWQGHDGNNSQIFVYSDGHIGQLTNSISDHIAPKINAQGDIAWVATGEDDHGVYLFQAASQSLFKLSDTPIGHHNIAIDLNDQGQVVWSGAYGNDFEITVASPTDVPKNN